MNGLRSLALQVIEFSGEAVVVKSVVMATFQLAIAAAV